MKIRTATKQETETVRKLKPIHGKAKGPVRLRIEAIEDEVAIFEGCCAGELHGTIGLGCPTLGQVKSAITNTQLKSPEKKFRHTHQNGAIYAWKVEG